MQFFNVMIKPSSSLCDMQCSYCFYSNISKLREKKSFGIMNDETSKNLIDNIYSYLMKISAPLEKTSIGITFQGGEPTLAGINYFSNFINYAKEVLGENCILNFSVQTNGHSLNDEWCRFFKEHNFLVGISLDGYNKVHDYYRKDVKGNGTYSKIISSIKL